MTWQPIETAPKDKAVLLYRPTALAWAVVAVGKWTSQQYNTRPRPYWEMWMHIGSVAEARMWVPTHWMPLPEPPEVTP